MLVLTRRVNETIVIAGDIRVTVLSADGGKIRLGIIAPDDVSVDREEVHARRAALTGSRLPPPEVLFAPAGLPTGPPSTQPGVPWLLWLPWSGGGR